MYFFILNQKLQEKIPDNHFPDLKEVRCWFNAGVMFPYEFYTIYQKNDDNTDSGYYINAKEFMKMTFDPKDLTIYNSNVF